ncbi:GGDEF domain-containing protein [Desulfovibrio ferrophilus]|uniref:Diguanylate cyclase/phosphodiesterase n=1 Tax=Desulfovibrio ferrophilus TaxID=241368 RepID=A0A2Z6AXX0_9BACT|nr:bifunctional diguanylate cyclase/phosphodiesterase [Desulfovibrio ferrophilus]BBD08112.1 diguanylate cyclase/phosphodiesterase [Desulfovibrio ferrophilus]
MSSHEFQNYPLSTGVNMLEAVRGFGSALFAKDSSTGIELTKPGESSLSFMRPGGRERIEAFLDSGSVVALFYIEVENFQVFLDIYGGMIAGRILTIIEEEIRLLSDELLSKCKLRYIDRLEPGKFLILCGDDQWQEEHLGDLVLTFRLKLKSRVKQETLNVTGQGLNVLTGYGMLEDTDAKLEDSAYRALSDARRVAAGTLDVTKLSLLREFREIVSDRLLESVFQPIVDLETGNIKSWEALTRGPKKSHFRSPAVLFDFAEEVDQVFCLERTCRESAIHRLGTLGQDQKLFLNIHPRTIVDPEFSPGKTLQLLEKVGLKAADVVLEITERHSVRDFDLFHRTLDHYRNQGFQVAVDDVGTGYSGLWSIAQIRPDYLKVDMSLVRGIDSDPVKRALMETLVTFSDNIGCRLIAEGIENEDELSTLMRMGVHYGQGYFLARPAYPKPGLPPEVQNHFSKSGRGMVGDRRIASPLRELVESVPSVKPETTVMEVKELLKGAGPMGAAVVVNGRRPVGLVMRHHLDSALSSQYGLSLYLNRPVSLIMDPSPLYAENGIPVENVAREAMKRKKTTVFDHVVVTERGRLQGVVSVQRMMDTIATAQVEMAKGANPLTGLPGNVVIELELERRCNSGESFAIIYADLDNFKVYNDTYGFKNGDKIIQLIATVTQWAARRHGDSSRDFVGHIGGDDLVIMCNSERSERIAKAITRCFGRLVKGCYMPADRDRGWIEAKGRDGCVQQFPLVSVSLAIVDCQGLCDFSVLGHRAAEMKKYAKSITGNSYVRDRRGSISGMESETDPEYCSIAIDATGHAGVAVCEFPKNEVPKVETSEPVCETQES